MSRRNKSKKQTEKLSFSRNSMLFYALLLTSLGSLFYINIPKNNTIKDITFSKQDTKTIYPSQYSDKHITKSAIDSNPQFSNIAFVNTGSLLANTISIVSNNSVIKSDGIESGTWLWTPILEQTANYRKSIISGAVKNGIKNIYLSIDSYLDIYIMPDGNEKIEKRKAFDKNVENFITEANKSGITVDAEAGWRNWAEDGNVYKALATINYADKFNKTHNVKFRGFQYDVEPYLLDSYKENKEKVLTNFLNLINNSVTFLNKSDLQLSVVIPEFYDGTNGDTPSFFYNGTKGYTTDHLLGILDRRAESKILVMSYRNFSLGADGTIDISKDEINSANKRKTKIIIAQETGDVKPPYITFYNTNKRYFNKQKKELEKTFSMEKSYGGIAIHYINAFMDLK